MWLTQQRLTCSVQSSALQYGLVKGSTVVKPLALSPYIKSNWFSHFRYYEFGPKTCTSHLIEDSIGNTMHSNFKTGFIKMHLKMQMWMKSSKVQKVVLAHRHRVLGKNCSWCWKELKTGELLHSLSFALFSLLCCINRILSEAWWVRGRCRCSRTTPGGQSESISSLNYCHLRDPAG